MPNVQIRDIGTDVLQVVTSTAPALAAPELLQVVIGLNRQVVIDQKAGEYANLAVDILLTGLLVTSVLDTSSVALSVTNEFGEFVVPKTTDITDLASFKLNNTDTATSLPAFLRVLRTSQAIQTTGVLTVQVTTIRQSPGSQTISVSGNVVTISTLDTTANGIVAGDILELNDVNHASTLRRFRITAVDSLQVTHVTVESLNPDGLGALAAGADTNIRVFKPTYQLTDTKGLFFTNQTRPLDDALPSGSKSYPQPGDTIGTPSTYSGLYAFANYSPLVGSSAIWGIASWVSDTEVHLKLLASGGTGPQWAGPPLFSVSSVRYSVTTQEPAIGRVPAATADVKQSYVALRNDLVGIATKVQGSDQALATFGPAVAANPLGLAMFLATTISPTLEVMGMAVATDDAVGHAVALDALTPLDDPYDLCPLTTRVDVISLYQAHVNAESAPAERRERTLTFSLNIPLRTVKEDLSSSVSITVTTSPNALTVTGATFMTDGVVPGDRIELIDTGNGNVLRQFTVTTVVSETKVEVASLNPDAVGALTTGSFNSVKAVTPNYTAAQKRDILVATAQAYADRRLTFVLPDKITLTPAGTDIVVDGSYAAVAVGALYANNEPGKPLSLAPVPGITKISGSNSQFTNAQMRDLTSAGVFLLIQKSPLVSPVIRFEVTTDTSNKKVQQRSFTRVVDALAKALRGALDGILGRDRLTAEFQSKAQVAISSTLENFLRKQRISDYTVQDFGISATDATALAVSLLVTIPNVANNVDITLVV